MERGAAERNCKILRNFANGLSESQIHAILYKEKVGRAGGTEIRYGMRNEEDD